MIKKSLLCLTIICAMCASVQAETIYFRNGNIIKGEIVHQSKVYIRLKSSYGVSEREFLLENIERIVKDGQVTYKHEFLGGLEGLEGKYLDELPEDVRRAAEAMAVSLIEEAMKQVDIPNIDHAPEGVKAAAQEKANEILKSAVLSAEQASPAVQIAATEIAAALIEQSVQNATETTSIEDAPQQAKEAARERATALMDEALRSEKVDSLTQAPEVKSAAKEKAHAWIEAAMKEADVPKASNVAKVIPVAEPIEESFPEEETAVDQNIEDTNEFIDEQEYDSEDDLYDEEVFVAEIEVFGQKVDAPSALEVSEEAPVEVVDESMDDFMDVLEDMVDENNLESMPEAQIAEEELFEEEFVEQAALLEDSEKVEYVEDAQTEEEYEEEEGEEAELAEEPSEEADLEKNFLKRFLSGLDIKDFLIFDLVVFLIFILYMQRRQKRKKPSARQYDVAVVSSLTYQNLPDDLKGRITSSDVTVILGHQANFQDQVGLDKASKGNKMVIIEDSQIIDYIFTHAANDGHTYTREDIGKVLEIQEKSLDEQSSLEG